MDTSKATPKQTENQPPTEKQKSSDISKDVKNLTPKTAENKHKRFKSTITYQMKRANQGLGPETQFLNTNDLLRIKPAVLDRRLLFTKEISEVIRQL